MSRTFMRMEWSVTVQDPERWDPKTVQAAHDDAETASYEGFAVRGLQDAMAAAGQAYIDAHRDMFDGDLL